MKKKKEKKNNIKEKNIYNKYIKEKSIADGVVRTIENRLKIVV